MYVRTGAELYIPTPKHRRRSAWGTSGLTKYVNNLTSSGTTNSAPAFTGCSDRPHNGIRSTPGLTNEQLQHKNKTGWTNLATYIVFMTDGDNNSWTRCR